MCQCPEPLQPPTTTIRNCRFILQGLAVGLLVLGVLAIFAGNIIQIFYYLMFIYILYLSWTTFNWCTTLIFFIFGALQFLIALISLIGLITRGYFFDNQYIFISIYALLQVIFYSCAIFLGHYAYKHFKNLGMDGMGIGPMRPQQDQNNNNNNNYRRFQQQRQRTNNEQTPNKKKQSFFQGQGVKIG